MASWAATEKCRIKGRTYEELRAGSPAEAAGAKGRDLSEVYLRCEDVFDEKLGSFSTALLNDYEACREAGVLDKEAKQEIRRRFAKLFQLVSSE